MNRTSACKLAALASAWLLVAAMAAPRFDPAPAVNRSGACTLHVPANSVDPLACPICGGSWSDLVAMMDFQIDVFVFFLTGAHPDRRGS